MKLNKIAGIVFAGCLSLFMAAAPVQAAGTTSYMVTFRPGSVAKFNDKYIEKAKSQVGKPNSGVLDVDVKEETTGTVKIKVKAGTDIRNLIPRPDDLEYVKGKEGRYTMSTDWKVENTVVTGNESFVVKYKALSDAVEYRVRYVDAQSGEDILQPMISQGNEGDTYTYYSKVISGYACDTDSLSLKLTKNPAKNEITFEYTSTLDPNVEQIVVPGDTITRVEEVPGTTTVVNGAARGGAGAAAGTTGGGAGAGAVGGAAAGAGAGAAGTAGGGAATPETPEAGEVINENDTPLSNQPENNENNEEDIQENDVPLSKDADSKKSDTWKYAVAGGVVVLLGAGGLLLYIRRKR